ncbi:ROK family protein [Parafrankia sp. EUN1f]|uniref:ROK family protein n=1 Tax=Parafrankia sp. EUN1f TaxID=102897 RepID=UPI0001C46283|nr:ROK family protein [Parafrankia sp. EUN1f]EFC83932.1 ROK family protein [Parafrankia sp. EUN1f]
MRPDLPATPRGLPATVTSSAGARQSTLRENNLALVARTVHAATTPMSRADVAAATSMTRATASRLVDELLGAAILDESGRPDSPRRGRPMTPLVPGARIAALGLQVDVGILAARVINLRGETLAERVETGTFAGSDPAAVLARLGRAARAVLDDLPSGVRLAGAGLALPGIVDQSSGLLLHAPNLGWTHVRPAELLADLALAPDFALAPSLAPAFALVPALAVAPLPLAVGNEADLAAVTVAQLAPGQPSDLSDFLYLSGGIGIGGAAVRGGEVIAGRHGWAGEIGHVCVDPNGPPCGCGSTGCLERYAGSHALATAAGLDRTATAEHLAELVDAGEPRAVEAVNAAAWALGVALASTVNILDVSTVVLGGHLGRIARLLQPTLGDTLRRRVLAARWSAPETRVYPQFPAPAATGAGYQRLAAVIADPARWISAHGSTHAPGP